MLEQNTRGGPRPGAGRRPSENPRQPYSERLTPEDIDWVRRRGGLEETVSHLRNYPEPEKIDYRAVDGQAFFCNLCREIRKYGVEVNLSDCHLNSHNYYLCKGCLTMCAGLVPGEDVPSRPSSQQPKGI